MYTLYDYPPSGNGYKVRLVMSMLGVDYQYQYVNILDGESRTQDFLSKNPIGRIPALATDNGVLGESHAICEYLVERHDEQGLLMPTDPWDRAQVRMRMCFEQYVLEPAIGVLRFRRASLQLTPEAMGEAYGELVNRCNAALTVLEGWLTRRTWLVADRLTLADIALFAYTHVAPEGDIVLTPYPAIQNWIKGMQDAPGFVAITDYPQG